jgi:Ca2+-binding RTX toxin-like protein
MSGGTGNDTYEVDASLDVVTEAAGAGTDTVRAASSYVLGANIENLVLLGVADINGTGNAAANQITGNSGANILRGGLGADVVDGGDGLDTASYAGSAAGVTVNLLGTPGAGGEAAGDTLLSIENLIGSAFGDALTGNGGDNVLRGGAGADSLNGGGGQDTASYAGSAVGVSVDLQAGTGVGGDAQGDLLTGIENLLGSGLKDTLGGDGNANLLDGGAGADTLIGRGGDDTYVVNSAADVITELAGEGTDTVRAGFSYSLEGTELENLTLTDAGAINATGNDKANTLSGNNAANRLDGKAGADTMAGAGGNDVYVVDDAGDTVSEATAGAPGGIDRVDSSVDFTLGANVEQLRLTGNANIDGTGNALANTLIGNSGDNLLDGGAGNDKLTGGAGNDTYGVDAVGDVVTEALGGGTDTVQALVNYVLGANVENLVLLGAGNLNGTGNAAANQITGNGGVNRIAGGLGNDTLTGGGDTDRFVFNTTPNAATNLDHITDFVGGADLILLENTVFLGLGAGLELPLDGGLFVAGPGLTNGLDANDRIVYDTTSGTLYYDANGAVAGSTAFAVLDGAPALAAADVTVI